jgi:hypothetical protein
VSDDLLFSRRIESGDSAAIVGNPQRAVRFGKDAFGPAKIVTNEADVITVDREFF